MLTDQYKNEIGELCILCGVRCLQVFGSVARGDERPESDVDFLVDFAEGDHAFDRFMNLRDGVSAACRSRF